MMNDIEKKLETSEEAAISDFRKPYFKPLLESLGDLRTLTLGGSPGGPDFSGGPGSEEALP